MLQAKDSDPVLCLGGVLDSLPPQCGGIPLKEWDWDAVSGEESAGGATWGHFEVTGLYDGDVFTVRAAGPPRWEEEADDPIEAACPEPEAGWERPNEALLSEEDYQRAIRAARRESDFSGAWIDYIDEPTEFTDPQDIILSLAFTGDLDRHEVEAREVWGGPLCVTKFDHTYRDLRRIQNEMGEVARGFGLEILYTDTNEYRGTVGIGVVVIDEATRAEIDERYGPGVVEIDARLQPVD